MTGHPKPRPSRSTRRPRRKLALTREGKYFLLITVGVGLGAINTGNNLLYLVLGWLLSTIIGSGVLSNLALRKLRVRRRPPGPVHANRPFTMTLEVENRKRLLASYSVELEDDCGGHPVDKRCYFLKIPAGAKVSSSYRHTIARRGLHRFEGVHVSTRYPFGLFRKTVFLASADEILVYPEAEPAPLPKLRARPLGESRRARRGRRGEFFAMREYREGDDQRAIHWKSTARSGRLLVREFEEEAQRRISLLIDNALPPVPGERERLALEDAIRTCAALAKSYTSRHYSIQLVARETRVPFGQGTAHLHRILRTLALLPTSRDECAFPEDALSLFESVLVIPRGVVVQRRPSRVACVVEGAA